MSFSVRPSADISTLLGGGPTACDASDAFVRHNGPRGWGIPLTIEQSSVSETSCSLPCTTSPTRAPESRIPKGSTPLNSFWARPSQKLRKLNTALITEGALRPVTRRTLTPPTLKTGSVPGDVVCSTALPGTTLLNTVGSRPAEPATSLVSDSTSELRSAGSLSRWNGKSPAPSWALGLCTSKSPTRGLSWFLDRLSAPAAKWQLAHDVTPSLPTCMSQNSALPSATPADSSLTNWPRFCGRGTGTFSSGTIGRGASTAPAVPSLLPPTCQTPSARRAAAVAMPVAVTRKTKRANFPDRALRITPPHRVGS